MKQKQRKKYEKKKPKETVGKKEAKLEEKRNRKL